MYRLMRNTHLALGLACLVMAAVFAVSSLVIIYRPWLPQQRDESERTVTLAPEQAATPRDLARVLMLEHGLKGDLGQIESEGGEVRLRIFRPGTEARVRYDTGTGQATIETRRWGALEMLVQLHVNHGFWHDFVPSQVWAALSLLASIGLLLLGASGLYLWFEHHQERRIGAALLVGGLIVGLTSLVLTRLAQ